ncbi:MAG TPA: cytochrome P450 [Gaiellaceae bacterium]|nr:cytochrome P450 [Gaiellaceae bacterium]
MPSRAAVFPIGAAATLAELEHDPHPLLARLREREPVSWLPALDGWLVTRRDLALAVMRDPAAYTVDDPRFSTAQVVGPSMLSLDGERHAAHRTPFARPFRLDAVRERFTSLVEAEAERLLDAVAPDGRADLRRTLAGPLSVTAMVHALGLDETPAETVLGWYEAIVAAVTAITAGAPAPASGAEAFTALCAAVEPALDGDPDVSLVAAAAGQAGGLTRAEVVSNAAVLLFGGIETTEGMIATALFHLLSHEDQRLLVEAEPLLLENAVEESLRLEPAASVVDRYATRDIRLAGAEIERGDLVRVSLAGANRDPAVFARPDAFDVRRANARLQLAFAQGPHVCLGMHLARLEARIALAAVLRQLPRVRLDPARSAGPRGLVFRKPPEVYVVWDDPGGTLGA